MTEQAFVLRMHPVGEDRVPEALRTGEISIGWGKVGPGLLDPGLSRSEVSDIVARSVYYRAQANRRSAGNAAGQLWRFNREMRNGALVVVPHGDVLHVARVIGSPRYVVEPAAEHWAYRRPVEWLTGPEGVARSDASSALRTRLRGQITCMSASDLIADIGRLER